MSASIFCNLQFMIFRVGVGCLEVSALKVKAGLHPALQNFDVNCGGLGSSKGLKAAAVTHSASCLQG
jgi:hypothetical protein